MWWYSLKIKAFAPKSLIPTESKNTGGVETEIVSFSLIKVNHLRIPPFYFVYFWAAQIRTAVQMPRSQVKIPSSPPSSLSSYKLGHRPGPHLGIWTMHKISQVLQKNFIAQKWANFYLRTHCIWSSPMSEQSTVPPRTRGTESLSKIFASLLFLRWSTRYFCQNLDFDLHVDRQGSSRRDHRASHPERSLSHLTSKTFLTPSEPRTLTEFNLDMFYHVLCSTYLA